MNLSALLAKRVAEGRPVRVGLIGAGKFGSMILAQARLIDGLHVVGIADLNVAKARESLQRVGWQEDEYAAPDLETAYKDGRTCIVDDAFALASFHGVECIVEATGHPIAGIRHALSAIEHNKNLVMVNVEADVLCGPILAKRARDKGLVYSMAYGDQPAMMCELVDWVKSCGFELVAAGKGMNFQPHYRYSTPDTVWELFGWSREQIEKDDLNPRLYNSFTDGTKAAIEMAAVANGTELNCPDNGLAFPPSGLQDLATIFRPVEEGGRLPGNKLLDIAASREPDGRKVLNNVQQGIFVTFKAPTEYARDCFKQYGLLTDSSGWYASKWGAFHMIGLEASISILSVCLRGEPTGSSKAFRGDAVATAKSDLSAGGMLDGEGGYAVWANAIPATKSLRQGALPIGLAHNVKLIKDIKKDEPVRFSDVDLTQELDVVELRKEMERTMAPTEA